MGTMGKEMQTLRARVEEASRLEAKLQAAAEENARMEGLYQMEQARITIITLLSRDLVMEVNTDRCCNNQEFVLNTAKPTGSGRTPRAELV